MIELTLLIAFSLAIGSFLACAAVRLPAGRGLSGRSACPHCHHVLGGRDLIPIASWLVQRGRCRFCHAKLSRLYPVVESAALAIALFGPHVWSGIAAVVAVGAGWLLLFLAASLTQRPHT